MKLWLRLAAVVAGSLAVGLGLSLFLLAAWLHATPAHSSLALQYFLISGLISLAIGIVPVLITIHFARNLQIKVAVASLCGSAAATINVLVTPLLMFSERSDKIILTITLLYFLALSVAFASIVAVMTTKQIQALRDGALSLAAGNFETRVGVQGMDEVADLARAFNRMSAELGAAFERERQLEQERRDLIVAVSHDLRTPLTSIRAMVEAINDGVVTDRETVARYLIIIQNETEHLGRLIEDLFELTRIENGSLDLRLSSVPLPELVQETVDGLQIHAREKGVKLDACVRGELPTLALDGPRIQRVLVNLIQNALRHTPPGGKIRVELARNNGTVQLAVADSGEGIALEDQPHVFERFYRGDKSRTRVDGTAGGGVGLGLAIARGIVEAHRGSIELESRPGEGSRFVVTLQARVATPESATSA